MGMNENNQGEVETEKPIKVTEVVAEVQEPDLSDQEIREIVNNYNCKEHEAPIVIGHPKDDSPSYGWIKKLRKKGNQMFAEMEIILQSGCMGLETSKEGKQNWLILRKLLSF
jgi:hypothetical protein